MDLWSLVSKNIAALIMLFMITTGVEMTVKDIPGEVNNTDLNLLAAAMELENGSGGDECLLLTGSVILNRAYYCNWCPDTIDGVLHQKGQYAKHTVNNLSTVKVPKRVKMLAKYLLVYGPICDKNVIFQSQNSKLGTKLYKKIKTSSGYEYFAYGSLD